MLNMKNINAGVEVLKEFEDKLEELCHETAKKLDEVCPECSHKDFWEGDIKTLPLSAIYLWIRSREVSEKELLENGFKFCASSDYSTAYEKVIDGFDVRLSIPKI